MTCALLSVWRVARHCGDTLRTPTAAKSAVDKVPALTVSVLTTAVITAISFLIVFIVNLILSNYKSTLNELYTIARPP